STARRRVAAPRFGQRSSRSQASCCRLVAWVSAFIGVLAGLFGLQKNKGPDDDASGPRKIVDGAASAAPGLHVGRHLQYIANPGRLDAVHDQGVADAVEGAEDHGIAVELVRQLHLVVLAPGGQDRKSTRLNSSHVKISYAVFCLKKKNKVTMVAN